jgi:hypothetical protein
MESTFTIQFECDIVRPSSFDRTDRIRGRAPLRETKQLEFYY